MTDKLDTLASAIDHAIPSTADAERLQTLFDLEPIDHLFDAALMQLGERRLGDAIPRLYHRIAETLSEFALEIAAELIPADARSPISLDVANDLYAATGFASLARAAIRHARKDSQLVQEALLVTAEPEKAAAFDARPANP